jgi:hypothetical protein
VALLAFLSEQAVLQVFDLGVLENNLLLQLLDLGFGSGMLGFPIACPMAKFDMVLFGNRNPFLRERVLLPFIMA